MAESTIPTQTEQDGELASTREESRYLVPPVDIYETEDSLVVMADLPGVTKETLEIRVENNILTIKAEPAYQMVGNASQLEFALMSFFRQFQLSEKVNQDKIQAEFKEGVLRLSLPKAEKAKPKQIQVDVQ